MVSTTADARHFAPPAPAAEVRAQPMPDDSAVGFAAPNPLYLAVAVLGAVAAFALPFILTSMGPHH